MTCLAFVLLGPSGAGAEPALRGGVEAAGKAQLKGWSGPKPKVPCECRHRGGKAALGQTICQMRGGQMVTLRCDMVLNNPNWTEISQGCDTAMMSVPAGAVTLL